MKLISIKDALDFADFYHNALRNAERRTVEEEFEKRNIQTIDPVEIIEQELLLLKNTPISRDMNNKYYIAHYEKIKLLEELLQKFNPSSHV